MKLKYPNVSVYPKQLFERWPSSRFTSYSHLRIGYEGVNSQRVADFVGDALGLPQTVDRSSAYPPPALVDLSQPAAWSSAGIGVGWQLSGISARVTEGATATDLVESSEIGLHRIEKTIDGLAPGDYILAVYLKRIDQRRLRLEFPDQVFGYAVCDPHQETDFRSGDIYDTDMTLLADGRTVCWASARIEESQVHVGLDLLPASRSSPFDASPAYAGDGRSGAVVDRIALYRGLRPATAETGLQNNETR